MRPFVDWRLALLTGCLMILFGLSLTGCSAPAMSARVEHLPCSPPPPPKRPSLTRLPCEQAICLDKTSAGKLLAYIRAVERWQDTVLELCGSPQLDQRVIVQAGRVWAQAARYRLELDDR